MQAHISHILRFYQFATVKRASQQADTSKLEGVIDQLVAPRQLWGVTEDEVRIMEGKG